MQLNRWHSGAITIRSLPPIATAGMTSDDIPALMEKCHAQMQAAIAELDRDIAAEQASLAKPAPAIS